MAFLSHKNILTILNKYIYTTLFAYTCFFNIIYYLYDFLTKNEKKY